MLGIPTGQMQKVMLGESVHTFGRWASWLWLLLLVAGCSDPIPVPKPRGYFRIDLPERSLRGVSSGCGPTFELPQYAGCATATRGEEPGFCGFNIVFPGFEAVIHCTYVAMDGSGEMLEALVGDAHDLAFNHDVKATGIGRQLFDFPGLHVHGLLYDLEGPVATPLQFFATDSVEHFVRGSLYFNHEPNPDSLAPALSHVRADLVHVIETLDWP